MGCGASRLDQNGLVIPIKARPLLFLRFEEFKRRRAHHPQSSTAPDSSKHELLHDVHHKGDNQDINNVKDNSNILAKSKDNGKESTLLTDETGSCVTSEEDSKGRRSFERDDSNGCETAKEEDNKSLDKGAKGKQHDRRESMDETVTRVQHCNTDGKDKIEDDDEEDEEDEEEEDDVDGGRMLGHEDGFPGSPSFRVFFTDNNKGGHDNKMEDVDEEFVEKAPIEKDDAKPSMPPMNEEVKRKEKKRRSFKKVLPTGKQAKNLFNVRACMSSAHQSNPDRTHLLPGKAHA